MVVRGDVPGQMGGALPAVDLGQGRTVLAVDGGEAHTCALLDDHTVKCWGIGAALGLGAGNGPSSARGDTPGEMGAALEPLFFGPGRSVKAIAAGNLHTCAILDNGAVKCWGVSQVGALGSPPAITRGVNPNEMGDALPDVDLGPGRTAESISAGQNTTCVVLDNHQIKCWGLNDKGQLGLGDKSARGDNVGEMGAALSSVDLGSGRTALAVACGLNHTCALMDDHRVKCWGAVQPGAAGPNAVRGDDPGEMGDTMPAVDLGPMRTAKAIAAGANHTCAVLDDASVVCWGADSGGVLGDGSLREVTAVTLGDLYSCALRANGRVTCWGNGAVGQLGRGTTAGGAAPVDVEL